MKKVLSTLSILGLSALSLTACSGSAESAPAPELCLEVPADLQKEITDASTGVTISPVKAAGYKHPEYPSAYLVAIEFSSSGGDNQTGVWSTSTLEGGGPIHAVDGTAKSFTDWKPADESVVPLDSTSAGVKESKACIS